MKEKITKTVISLIIIGIIFFGIMCSCYYNCSNNDHKIEALELDQKVYTVKHIQTNQWGWIVRTILEDNFGNRTIITSPAPCNAKKIETFGLVVNDKITLLYTEQSNCNDGDILDHLTITKISK